MAGLLPTAHPLRTTSELGFASVQDCQLTTCLQPGSPVQTVHGLAGKLTAQALKSISCGSPPSDAAHVNIQGMSPQSPLCESICLFGEPVSTKSSPAGPSTTPQQVLPSAVIFPQSSRTDVHTSRPPPPLAKLPYVNEVAMNVNGLVEQLNAIMRDAGNLAYSLVQTLSASTMKSSVEPITDKEWIILKLCSLQGDITRLAALNANQQHSVIDFRKIVMPIHKNWSALRPIAQRLIDAQRVSEM